MGIWADSNYHVRIASSDIYWFTVGSFGRQFSIHSVLVEALCPELRVLAHNTKCEDVKCHYLLDEVDEDTFAAFVEFAYTGKYGGASNIKAEPSIPETLFLDDIYIYKHLSSNNEYYCRPGTKWRYLPTPGRPKLWQKFVTAVAGVYPNDCQPCSEAGGKS